MDYTIRTFTFPDGNSVTPQDFEEFNGVSNFPATGKSGQLYVDSSTNEIYRWNGSSYVDIGPDISGKLDSSLKGAVNGLAELDSSGKVPSSQLPSYVDDVVEAYYYDGAFYEEDTHTTQITPESGKIYVDITTNKTYRWSGSVYTVIASDLALGETSSTAYRGDRGAAAYAAAVTNVESSPSSGSGNLITSGAVYSGLDDKAPKANPIFTGSISLGRKENTTVGSNSFAVGSDPTASGANSHAEGYNTSATNSNAHAEGYSTTASGEYSHAEGNITTASAMASHAEGNTTTASGQFSHAEGNLTRASGDYSHAEGLGGVGYGALGKADHAEGYDTIANSGGPAVFGAHAEGSMTTASADSAHAEGKQTVALGAYSHAEGLGGTYTENGTTKHYGAYGTADHVEGFMTLTAQGQPGNHAEGYATKATGGAAHSEGAETVASGTASHAEGGITTASGLRSHSEGEGTTASGYFSHAEGKNTTANHKSQHAIGEFNVADPSTANSNARGNYIEIVGNGIADNARSNARTLDWDGNERLKGDLYVGCNADSTGGTKVEPLPSVTSSDNGKVLKVTSGAWSVESEQDISALAPKASPVFTGSISLGRKAGTTIGNASVAVGNNVEASGGSSHAEGAGTAATWSYAHAEGNSTQANAQSSHAEGESTIAGGSYSHAEGYSTQAVGNYSHAEGYATSNSSTLYGARGKADHTEGYNTLANSGTTASYYGAHAEGKLTKATSSAAHAEGISTTASGSASHAEGDGVTASGSASHAEGSSTKSSGYQSHAEGSGSDASGSSAHAEGYYTVASGNNSHAEGYYAKASGAVSHAEGMHTTASGSESHVEGTYTVASGLCQHVFGMSNVENAIEYIDLSDIDINTIPEWVPGKSYQFNAIVKSGGTIYVSHNPVPSVSYPPLDTNNWHKYSGSTTGAEPDWDSEQTYSANSIVKIGAEYYQNHNAISTTYIPLSNNIFWHTQSSGTVGILQKYIEIVGNGSGYPLSNARTLDWDGNERLKGDVYVGCNADSSGGTKLEPLPTVTSSDNGKVLGVSSGAWAAVAAPSGLPSVTSSDEGKVLRVVRGGNWAAVTYPAANQLLPAPPWDDGTYFLQCSVSGGSATYSWVTIPAANGVSF